MTNLKKENTSLLLFIIVINRFSNHSVIDWPGNGNAIFIKNNPFSTDYFLHWPFYSSFELLMYVYEYIIVDGEKRIVPLCITIKHKVFLVKKKKIITIKWKN